MVFLDPTVDPVVVATRTTGGFRFHSTKSKESVASLLGRLYPKGFPKNMDIVIVDGPGRFSSLRLAAVAANMLAAMRSAQLYRVRGPVAHPLTPQKLSRVVDKRRRVRALKPFYGKPPSITISTKARKI